MLLSYYSFFFEKFTEMSQRIQKFIFCHSFLTLGQFPIEIKYEIDMLCSKGFLKHSSLNQHYFQDSTFENSRYQRNQPHYEYSKPNNGRQEWYGQWNEMPKTNPNERLDWHSQRNGIPKTNYAFSNQNNKRQDWYNLQNEKPNKTNNAFPNKNNERQDWYSQQNEMPKMNDGPLTDALFQNLVNVGLISKDKKLNIEANPIAKKREYPNEVHKVPAPKKIKLDDYTKAKTTKKIEPVVLKSFDKSLKT